MFWALAKRSAAFGGVAERFVTDVTRIVAAGHGVTLEIEDGALAAFRTRILFGMMRWIELRDAFAERQRPIGGPGMEPPKRPR